MAKRCLKKDLQKLENNIDDLIMLEDSARGTLCAIHKTIHPNDNFPLSQHQMIKLCPTLKSCNIKQTRIPISRFRRKSQSSSPCRTDGPKMCRAQSAHNPYRGSCCPSPHIYCKLEKKKHTHPDSYTAEYVNVEKTISCPEKMCCNKLSNKTCTVTSRSSVQIDQFAQSLLNTDEVVNELKGEIQKVKHQLHHLSRQNVSEPLKSKIPCAVKASLSTRGSPDESQMTKLKDENKRLKREIEAKKRLLIKSRNDVTKAKDILADYEKKVSLLHVQALKSSKAMKLSKEKFCKCLKEKDEKLRLLQESNDTLKKVINEEENFFNERDATIESLRKALGESNEKCSMLSENKQELLDSIDLLKAQVLNSSTQINSRNRTIEILEKKILDLNCICKKVASKTKKQKINYETLMKSSEEGQLRMAKEISELSTKLAEAEQRKISVNELECRCQELQEKVLEYEKLSDKCKILEEECEKQHQQLIASNNLFEKDKKEMEKLIDELTTVVKTNKTTILQMSEINQQQEAVIKKQNMTLLTKEEQLKVIEKESEEFKVKTKCLEQEVQELRNTLFSEPCSKEACLCISRELDEIKKALNVEKDTQLIKEKIIEDQSQTILNLQSQVKEKMLELTKAQNDTSYLEEEIGKINEKLIEKHQELDNEIDEKENLIEKLRVLECQRNQLAEEISDFETMLQQFKKKCGDNENQQAILRNLEDEIAQQKQEWNMQKNLMVKEKQKAVCAAKFATQKLLDTVADFQRQVDAQKKVQLLLTKMLHEKDEQLRIVNSKISNINSITKDIPFIKGKDSSMKEIFFHKENTSDPNTNTSMYSSCSSCCKKPDCVFKNMPKYDNIYGFSSHNSPLGKPSFNLDDVIKVIKRSIEEVQEVPSRDLT